MPSHLNYLFTSDFYSLPHDLQHKVFDEFYRLVYPMVYYTIKDHGAAEDIIQESFMRAIQKSDQLQELDKLEGWLKTLTRNVMLNFLKKFTRSRDELDFQDVFPNREVACASASSLPVEQEVEVKLMREAMCRYLDELKSEYRQVIEMRWVHHLSYKEIAELLNTSEGTVRQKLFRAREAVKHRFHEEWGTR